MKLFLTRSDCSAALSSASATSLAYRRTLHRPSRSFSSLSLAQPASHGSVARQTASNVLQQPVCVSTSLAAVVSPSPDPPSVPYADEGFATLTRLLLTVTVLVQTHNSLLKLTMAAEGTADRFQATGKDRSSTGTLNSLGTAHRREVTMAHHHRGCRMDSQGDSRCTTDNSLCVSPLPSPVPLPVTDEPVRARSQ